MPFESSNEASIPMPPSIVSGRMPCFVLPLVVALVGVLLVCGVGLNLNTILGLATPTPTPTPLYRLDPRATFLVQAAQMQIAGVVCVLFVLVVILAMVFGGIEWYWRNARGKK